jgi:endonuclease-3 related protein
MIGAVLTQRTTWRNVDLVLDNVEHALGLQGLSEPGAMLEVSADTLVDLLRPTGHFASKPRKLQGLARAVLDAGGVEALISSPAPTESLREWLLGIWGIGPETADAILLYALQRPVFVADAYALRLATRWGLLKLRASYPEIQRLFTEHLPADVALFNEYHALIVAHGKEICRLRPLCGVCPLNRSLSLSVVDVENASWRCPWLFTDN